MNKPASTSAALNSLNVGVTKNRLRRSRRSLVLERLEDRKLLAADFVSDWNRYLPAHDGARIDEMEASAYCDDARFADGNFSRETRPTHLNEMQTEGEFVFRDATPTPRSYHANGGEGHYHHHATSFNLNNVHEKIYRSNLQDMLNDFAAMQDSFEQIRSNDYGYVKDNYSYLDDLLPQLPSQIPSAPRPTLPTVIVIPGSINVPRDTSGRVNIPDSVPHFNGSTVDTIRSNVYSAIVGVPVGYQTSDTKFGDVRTSQSSSVVVIADSKANPTSIETENDGHREAQFAEDYRKDHQTTRELIDALHALDSAEEASNRFDALLSQLARDNRQQSAREILYGKTRREHELHKSGEPDTVGDANSDGLLLLAASEEPIVSQNDLRSAQENRATWTQRIAIAGFSLGVPEQEEALAVLNIATDELAPATQENAHMSSTEQAFIATAASLFAMTWYRRRKRKPCDQCSADAFSISRSK